MVEALANLATDGSLINLLLAIILGGLVGLERELHGRAAGFRTHILVCLGATIITLASTRLYSNFAALTSDSPIRIDPGRITAGIVTGIGFLGAGVILSFDNTVRGLTTAACVWFTAGLGITIGIGLRLLACEATFFALVVLFLFGKIEDCIPQDWYGKLSVTANRKIGFLQELVDICRNHGLTVKGYEIIDNIKADSLTIVLNIRFKRQEEYIGQILVDELTKKEGIRQVQWK